MRAVTITQLIQRTKDCLDAVEAGETLEVYRRGRLIARIYPVPTGLHPRWVSRRKPVRLRGGASAGAAVIDERRGARY